MDMFRIYSPVSRQLIIIGSRLECPWEMALWSKYSDTVYMGFHILQPIPY